MTSATPEEQAEGLVTLFLDERLKDANEPPGLREAVTDMLVGQVDDIGKRFRQQIDHLRIGSARRIRTRTSWTKKSPRTTCKPVLRASGPPRR
jgi:hypothetical protein